MNSRKLGITLSYIYTGLNMVCGLLLSAYLLRMLGVLEYGIYQTIASFANYLVLLQFGTGTVMTRNISMCRARNASRKEIENNVNAIWSVTMILAAVIVAVGLAFYSSIDEIYRRTMTPEDMDYAKQIFLYVLVHLTVSFLMQTLNGVVLAHEKYSFISAWNIVRTIFRTGFLLILIYFCQRAKIIAQADAAISLLQCILVAVYIGRLGIHLKIVRPDREILRGIAPLCFALFLQTIVNQANNNVDKFLIGMLISPESVAVYSVGMYVYSIFSSMTTIPISMYAPMVAKEIQLGTSMSDLENHLIRPCRLTAVIGGMIYFGFMAVGRQFVSVVYGEAYLTAWAIALLIMTPMYINMINGVLVNVLDAMNKRLTRSLMLMVTTVLNILLTIVWLQKWGLIGAAMATAVCTLIGQVIAMNVYYSRKLQINVLKLFRESLRGVLVWFFAATAAALFVGKQIDQPLPSLLMGMVTFLLVWIAGYLWKGITAEEREIVRKIVHR